MKKLLLILLIGVTFSACKKDPEPFRLDADAKIYVKPDKNYIATKTSQNLTPFEVVKQATLLRGYNTEVMGSSHISWGWIGKDTISDVPALLRWGTDIIHDKTGYGEYGLQYEFINSFDLIIARETNNQIDTIAYIPNANMLAAKEAIIAAFENNDNETVYELFKEAFRFIPISAEDYKLLKKQGLQ